MELNPVIAQLAIEIVKNEYVAVRSTGVEVYQYFRDRFVEVYRDLEKELPEHDGWLA